MNLSKLSKKELKYFRIMRSLSGVLYITSKPGIAKSSIARSIADKLDMQYLYIPLSMIDETDIGLYPRVVKLDDGREYLDHVIPLWAHKANQKPTIIHFEELNRSHLSVRNAALIILLERTIGNNFKFNDNVYFISSGNLGTEDGTEVEEFDNALNNRLIHINHTLTLDEWIDGFANDNVYSKIIDFLKAYPKNYYVNKTDNCSAYATPRSWTFLSDYIKKNVDESHNIDDVIDLISDVGSGYIGNTIVPFITYLKSVNDININDVIKNFDNIRDNLIKSGRGKLMELLVSLKEITKKIEDGFFNNKNLSNIISFLTLLSPEERASYILYIIDKSNVSSPDIKYIITPFLEEVNGLRKMSKESNV